MKNVIIGILVISTVVVGYFAATSKLRLSNIGLEGKLEKVIRGDLTIPINATGGVRPAHRVEVKAEASGEVIAIYKQPGERVRTVPADHIVQAVVDEVRKLAAEADT